VGIHREIFILAKMDHPNIMKLYEVLDSSTHVNLVLQLCPGLKLNEYLQKYGTKGRIGINNNITSYLSEIKSKYIFK
jgi:serine/threonine protein kinase